MTTLLDLMADRKVFGPWFRRGDWSAWGAFLAALFALPMSEAQATAYRACTGRSEVPVAPFSEAWLVVGRRGGKSFILALVAVFLATFKDWRPYLAPGERATIMVIAADRRQARVIMRYVKALLAGVPMLKRLIERQAVESVDLANAITIEVHTASFRSVRGYTLVAALLDEVAFWRSDESASPDSEILAALRPAMATVPGSILLAASSPYARRGVLYKAWSGHHGKDSPILVWQAGTRTMNPDVPEAVVAAAYEADPASAAAEYGAQFRSDVESFVAREAVDACTVAGRHELPPVPGVAYVAFADPSGGSQDSMTLAIAHLDGKAAVLDAVRERKPPFSPEAVVQEFAALLKSYRLGTVHGDRYAGEWPREVFANAGIGYLTAGAAKSDIYRDALPLLNGGRVALLDLPKLQAQIIGLERRTARGGRDSIDHAPGAHDDVANAVLGAVWLVQKQIARPGPSIRSLGDDVPVAGHWQQLQWR
jgi:hypothetical protein